MIVLFDGVCNLCNGWVDFVIRRDPKKRIRFAPLQSRAGGAALAGAGLRPEAGRTDSIVLVAGKKYFTKSGAVLRAARALRFPWPILAVFLLVPPFLRDFVYDLVARNRYRVFGRRADCRVPSPSEKERFLD